MARAPPKPPFEKTAKVLGQRADTVEVACVLELPRWYEVSLAPCLRAQETRPPGVAFRRPPSSLPRSYPRARTMTSRARPTARKRRRLPKRRLTQSGGRTQRAGQTHR